MRNTVTRLISLADMITWWNTCHESQYQLRLVWHHMISWSRLMIKIDDQDWLHDHVENSCSSELYSEDITST